MAKIFLSVPVLGRPDLKMMYSMYQAILSCAGHQVRVYFNQNDFNEEYLPLTVCSKN
jgi:hypothetical protein